MLAGFGGQVADAVERVEALDGRFLALALVLQLATLAFRALAWRNVLAAAYPRQRIPAFSIGCAYASGVALNAFLPARGGEGAKVALARAQLRGSSVPTIAASLSVVLLLDAILGGSLVAILWATGVLPSLPALPSVAYGRASVAVGVVLVVAVPVLARRFAASLRGLLGRAARGLAILRSPLLYVRSVLPFQLAAWACRIGVVFFVLQAFHIRAGIATAVLVMVLTGASTAVPVPGGAGSQQVLAAFALQGAISAVGAMSFSLSMQIGVTVVNTTVGLVAAMLLFRTLRPLAAVRAVAWKHESQRP